jgi:hypothetical protein
LLQKPPHLCPERDQVHPVRTPPAVLLLRRPMATALGDQKARKSHQTLDVFRCLHNHVPAGPAISAIRCRLSRPPFSDTGTAMSPITSPSLYNDAIDELLIAVFLRGFVSPGGQPPARPRHWRDGLTEPATVGSEAPHRLEHGNRGTYAWLTENRVTHRREILSESPTPLVSSNFERKKQQVPYLRPRFFLQYLALITSSYYDGGRQSSASACATHHSHKQQIQSLAVPHVPRL